MVRLDKWLVENGQVDSRSLAQKLIREGCVSLQIEGVWKVVAKPNFLVSPLHPLIQVKIQQSDLQKYVSRGGLKLEGALEHVGLQVRDLLVLDVGLSTGGFSDCLLQKGVRQVIGVDVGSQQLHPRLQKNSRLIAYERVNARDLSGLNLKQFHHGKGFDLAVIDVSFISLQHVLSEVLLEVAIGGYILALVKPQFELEPSKLAKGGIVKNPIFLKEVQNKILSFCQNLSCEVKDYFACAIEGGDGNQEFFIWIQKV